MIRKATSEDLAAIQKWLAESTCDEEICVDGTCFYYPRSILDRWDADIVRSTASGKMLVYCTEGTPVGFMTGGPESEFHLVVNENFRRRGIARELVQYVLDRESRKGETLWYFKIRDESRPFWEKMGFNISYQTVRKDPFLQRPYAWRNIERIFPLPSWGVDVDVEIHFKRCEIVYTRYDKRAVAKATPDKVFHSPGKFVFKGRSRGTIYFPSQVQFNFGELQDIVHHPFYNWNGVRDVYVHIWVNGFSVLYGPVSELSQRKDIVNVYAGCRMDTLILGKGQPARIFSTQKSNTKGTLSGIIT